MNISSGDPENIPFKIPLSLLLKRSLIDIYIIATNNQIVLWFNAIRVLGFSRSEIRKLELRNSTLIVHSNLGGLTGIRGIIDDINQQQQLQEEIDNQFLWDTLSNIIINRTILQELQWLCNYSWFYQLQLGMQWGRGSLVKKYSIKSDYVKEGPAERGGYWCCKQEKNTQFSHRASELYWVSSNMTLPIGKPLCSGVIGKRKLVLRSPILLDYSRIDQYKKTPQQVISIKYNKQKFIIGTSKVYGYKILIT